jgi:hypothetical protein
MSKYAEIAELASLDAERFYEEKLAARRSAMRIAIGCRDFLQAPEEALSSVTLDQELRAAAEPMPLTTWPEVRLGDDGDWYFGLRIHFEVKGRSTYGDVTLKIGVKPRGDGVSAIRHGDENFDDSDLDLERFVTFIHRELVEHYSAPRGQRRRRPGFVE